MTGKLRPAIGRLQSAVGLLIILVLAIALSPRTPRGDLIFLQTGNLTDILRQISETGVMSVGMTLVILSAGIDLSVGSTLALAATVVAILLTRWTPAISPDLHIALAVAAAVAAAAVVGAVNGIVISTLRIQPFVVTLATMIGIRGLARRLTNNTNIDFGFGGRDVSGRFAEMGSLKVLVVGVFIAAAVIFAIVLARTVFGRRVRAIGDNERAAQFAGLPIRRTRVWVYTMCALLSGVAGVIHAAQNHQGNPNAGVSYELDAIAAVVIGGTSLSGGRGSIFGTVIGTLIMGILTNMLRLNNVDSNSEMMLKAVIIVAAVWIQQTRLRLFEKGESQ